MTVILSQAKNNN